LDDLATTDVAAALTAKDTLAAFAAHERADWYVAAPSSKAGAAIEKQLLAGVSVIQAQSKLARVQLPAGTRPGFLAIRFDSDDKLWVLSTDGPRQLSADGDAMPLEADAAPLTPWPRDVLRKDGSVLSNVAYACDQPSVSLQFSQKGGGTESVATALLSPRPGSCRPNSTFEPPAAVAVGVKDGEPMLLLGASWIGPRQTFAEASLRPQPPGAPRSPDGKHLAAATRLGILVQSMSGAQLWQSTGLADHGALACTVNDGANRVACTTAAGRVLLLSK
jgi:hypothetical protein